MKFEKVVSKYFKEFREGASNEKHVVRNTCWKIKHHVEIMAY